MLARSSLARSCVASRPMTPKAARFVSGHMDQNDNDGGVVLETYIKNKYNYSERTDSAKILIETYIAVVRQMNASLANYRYVYRFHSQDVNRVLAAQGDAWRDIAATSNEQNNMFNGFVDPNNDVCEPCEYGIGAGPKAAVAGDDYGTSGLGDMSDGQMIDWDKNRWYSSTAVSEGILSRGSSSRGLVHGLNDQNGSNWTIYIDDANSSAYAYPIWGYDGKAPNYSLPPSYMQGAIDVKNFFWLGSLFDKEADY